MKIYKKKLLIAFLTTFLLLGCRSENDTTPVFLEGNAFGTTFHITYFDLKKRDFSTAIDSLFNTVNKSLSTYIPTSDISRINRGDTSVVVDSYFAEVFDKSQRIYNETNGIFDPTIGVLVNAWGFGPAGEKAIPDSASVKKLLHLVGFDKVALRNNKVVKPNDSIYFDFNAIAKGYAVDVAGRFLEGQGITDYLVEIGGEIRAKGKNMAKELPWTVGIETPNFDGSRSIQKKIRFRDESIATSGNYRKFKTDSISGRRYTHILNTHTGYPSQTDLLSVSVMGNMDCADVDGYATAIMAMPLQEAIRFFDAHPELKGYIIYNNDKNELATYSTPDFESF